MSTHLPTDTDSSQSTHPSVEAILDVDCGDAIAVRAKSYEEGHIIVAGVISTPPLSHREIEENLTESDRTGAISLDAGVYWTFFDSESHDLSHKLQDRPPYRPYPGEPLKDAPHCTIACDQDRTLTLIIPGPIYSRSRIKYYAPDPHGTVDAIDAGALVDPELLIPDGYTPPG